VPFLKKSLHIQHLAFTLQASSSKQLTGKFIAVDPVFLNDCANHAGAADEAETKTISLWKKKKSVFGMQKKMF
jgi:hypothetical protein